MDGKYTITELIDEIKKQEIDLGTNPIRTIRYYIAMDLLPKPEIKQEGKKRISCYNQEHLIKLKLINFHKKQNLSLNEIKEKINEHLYWSDYALRFIEQFEDEIPDNVFKKNKTVTRYETAFFLSKLLDFAKQSRDYDKTVEILLKAFVDKNGKPIEDLKGLLGGHSIGSKENHS